MSKFKVGDRVRVNDTSGFSRGSCGTVIEDKREKDPTKSPLPEGAVNVKRDQAAEDDCVFFFESELDLLEVSATPQTSNEKPPYVSFFTSVIVAKNKDVSDIGSMLYDENTTKISLEDEGGGAFLILEQDYNGAIQQIRLDIDEVDTVFSAIKQLVNQLEVNNGN